MKTMTLSIRILVAFVVSMSALIAATPSQAAVETNVAVPFESQVFVPCANGELGELVNLSGALHVLSTATVDADGGIHLSLKSQPMGITGIGESTGDKYQGTGVTRANLNVTAAAHLTLVNNFRIIGQGRGNNFLVHETLVITVNADGTVTVAADHFSIDCK